MSSHARHRAPGRAHTPLSDISDQLSAKRVTVAVASAGVLVSLTPGESLAAPAAQTTTATTTAAKAATTTQTATKKKKRSYRKTSRSYRRSYKRSYRYRSYRSSYRFKRVYRNGRYRYVRKYYRSYRSSRSYRRYTTPRNTYTTPKAVVTPKTSTPVVGARAKVLDIMKRYEGIYYRYGGTTPAGFDCSGFTQFVFRQVGISLPRTSSSQRYAGREVSRAEGRPGDLVWMPGHVGIYLGNGMIYDSPRTGKAIGARKIWRSSYKIIRLIND